MASLLISEFSALILIAVLASKIQTRKMVHILIGPIFMIHIDLFDLKNNFALSIFLASLPFTCSFVFFLSKYIKQLNFIKQMISRWDKADINGVIYYGFLFGLYAVY